MIVTLRDRTEIYLNAEQGQRLEMALLDPETPDYIKLGKTTVRKDFIVKLQEGGTPPDRIADESRLIAQPEISDEQRAKNLKKLAKIKADFNKKRLAKAKAK